MWIAGWLIRASAFVGITRWQLVLGWIYTSAFIYFMPFSISNGVVPFVIVFALLFESNGSCSCVTRARQLYRDDDVLSSGLQMSASQRLLEVAAFTLVGFILTKFITSKLIAFHFIRPATGYYLNIIYCLKVFLPHIFWIYFCCHQSPKNPITLRSVFKSTLRAILSPIPKPVPNPVSSFAPPT